MMDSVAIGKFVQPMMVKLMERVELLDAALLCTADGFNVCSVGFSQIQIGKLSALASTLLSIGEATIDTLSETPKDVPLAPNEPLVKPKLLDTLILEAGEICLVGVQLHTKNPLHLIATSRKTAMGVLLVSVQRTAKEIEARLKTI